MTLNGSDPQASTQASEAGTAPEHLSAPPTEGAPRHDPAQPPPPDERRTAHSRRRRAIAAIAVIVLIAAAIPPAQSYWHRHRSNDFKSQCRATAEVSDWNTLKDVSRAWLQWDPTSDDARVFVAEAHAQLGELAQAAEILGGIDDDYHGALQALAICAEFLFSDLNRPLEAEATWQRMLRIDPRTSVAHQRLIYFYAMTLQRRKLLDQIESAMNLGCEPPEAYTYLVMANSLNFSDGLTQLTRWRQSAPDSEVFAAAQAVYAAKQTSNRGMAIFGEQTVVPGDQTLLDRCLEKFPSNLEALTVKIDFALFEGNSERVAELLAQAAPHAEHDSRFWRFRGWLLSINGKHAAAESSFRHALELYPFDWQSRWMLADVLRKLKRIEEADRLAQLATQGKELQQKLFERPNARELDEELIAEMHAYFRALDVSHVLSSLERRL